MDVTGKFSRTTFVNGGVKVKNFRPYLGLGFGRLIPKNRLGIRFELGAQFQGKPVVYADDVGDVLKKMDQAHRTTSLSLWTIYRFIQC